MKNKYLTMQKGNRGKEMQGTNIVFVEFVLLSVAFFWGINPPIMKIGMFHLSPVAYNALRMLMAIPFVWGAVYFSKTYRPFDRQDIPQVIKLSVLGFFIFTWMFTIGLDKTTAGNASLILSMIPVSVAIINKLFRIEEITGLVMTGIMVSLLGVGLIVVGSGKELSLANEHLLGAVQLFAAQFAYGYFTVFSRNLLQKYSNYQFTAYAITIATACFLVVAAPELALVRWDAVPAAAWASALYSGAFAICAGNFLWVWGVSKIGSTKTALFGYLSPVFAVSGGYLFLGEAFGMLQFAGAAVIFTGLYLTRKKSSSVKPEATGL